MAIRRPPPHAADAAPLFLPASDDAWDDERIERERKALKNEGSERHPVTAYFSGATRYDLDAPATIAGQVMTPRAYLREGSTPTVFHLRRDANVALRRAQALAVWADARARESALWELVRHGVSKVTEGFAGQAWPFDGGGPFPLTDADMLQLHDIGAGLLHEVGLAVFFANGPLSDIEGKP
jgi:hypothetical protein